MANLLRLSVCLFVLLSFNVFAVDTDGNQAELSALEALGINKQVPAIGGIGLLALGLSMLGLDMHWHLKLSEQVIDCHNPDD